jgi:hypothetical protein
MAVNWSKANAEFVAIVLRGFGIRGAEARSVSGMGILAFSFSWHPRTTNAMAHIKNDFVR